MLHERAGTRAAAAADIDLAAGRAMAGRIAGIALDRDDAAGVQPADIRRGRAVDDDLGVLEAHRADALARIRHMEMQRLSFRMPKRSADIMLAGGRYIKFRFPIPDSILDGQQEVLGGHTIMSFKGFHFKHFVCLP